MDFSLPQPVRLEDLALAIYQYMGFSSEPGIYAAMSNYKKESEGIDRWTAILDIGEKGYGPHSGCERYFEISTMCHPNPLMSEIKGVMSSYFKVRPGPFYINKVEKAVERVLQNQPIPIQSLYTENIQHY